MGKIKKIKASQRATKIPLDQQIEEENLTKHKNRNKLRFRKDDDDQVRQKSIYILFPFNYLYLQFVDSDLSRKILSAAREQQRELESEFPALGESFHKRKPTKLDVNSDEESDSDSGRLGTEAFYENIEINKEDEDAIEKFMNKNPGPRRTLADIILEKITEKQTELETRFSDAGTIQVQDIDPRVTQMYEGVRDVLRIYRSGKLPKAFKIIPSLKNWEQILYITGTIYLY